MKFSTFACFWCKQKVRRSRGRINEAEKFAWKTYCSQSCQANAFRKQKEFQCANLQCNARILRTPHNSRSAALYCSRSCAAIVNNTKYPKRKAVIKVCAYCRKNFKGSRIYCATYCKNKAQMIDAGKILQKIRGFCKQNGRFPLKRECINYNAARNRFGTWNNAVAAAGFNPNPVKFAKKHLAKDGHICDSLAEKIIDDLLSKQHIHHERNKKYPDNPKLTADFVTDRHWIEFFGLRGEIKEYDILMKRKKRLAKKYKLPLVAIYPKDLFPISRLAKILL